MSSYGHCWVWWHRLGAAVEAGDRERLATVADRALAVAVAGPGAPACVQATVREVARVRALLLDDLPGARTALDAGVRLLADGDDPVDEWLALAASYHFVLGDRDAARRCVADAADLARRQGNVADLTRTASTLGQILDHDGAVALVEEAERLLPGRWHEARDVAIAYRALGLPEAETRVIASALAAARTTDEALTLGAQWVDRGPADKDYAVVPALARARALATGAGDWLRIAQVAYRGGYDEGTVSELLREAAARPASPPLRARIGGAWLGWYANLDEATRLGPYGLDPASLRTRRRRLDGWRSSPGVLLDWLRPRVTDEMIARIASYDYGYGADLNAVVLTGIRDTGLVPAWMPFSVTEVLGLGRWAEGPDVDHVERAWCCVLLSLYGTHPIEELDDCAPVLVDSCLALGPPAGTHAEALFAWLAETDGHVSEDRWDTGEDEANPLALIALLILRTAADPDDPRVATLAGMILTSRWYLPEGPTALFTYCTRAELWRALATRILLPARTLHSDLDALVDFLVRNDAVRSGHE